MHVDEVDIDLSLVLRLLADQFPQWSHLPVEPVLPLGTDNALYRLGDELVLRLPRRKRVAESLEKECHWLPRLASHLPVAVPSPQARGFPTAYYPFGWSIYAWLNGENATINRVDDLDQLAADLARFLVALQKIDSGGGPAPGAHNFFRGARLVTRDEATRRAISSVVYGIDRDLLTVVWDKALQVGEWDSAPVWVHGDLDARNLLVENGRLSAVIDFGGLGVGDPACDVMVCWKLFRGMPAKHSAPPCPLMNRLGCEAAVGLSRRQLPRCLTTLWRQTRYLSLKRNDGSPRCSATSFPNRERDLGIGMALNFRCRL